MSRWKVSQHIFYRSWLAYPESVESGKPGSDLADDEPRPLRPRAFRTWAEAMAYADQRARIIEVTLPPEEYVWESGVDSDGRHYVTDRWDNTICHYPNGDENGEGTLKEIALHFLAYAYKMTNKEN